MSQCTGACCVVFPLSSNGTYVSSVRDWMQERAAGGNDNAFIGNMIFPLTLDEAKSHWVAFNAEPLPDWIDDHHELYGCRHWDSGSRKCTAYAQRPLMCSAYPYVTPGECEFCGYSEPIAWWAWDPKQRAYRETRAAREKHGTDWQMPAGWPFTWDGEWLRPVATGG